MASEEIATVRWGSLNSPASLYGTSLRLNASGDVHLANPLMSSGTTIQEWYSFTDYQSMRDVPTLPLLQQGRSYRIAPAMHAVPGDSVIFEVRFLDRFDELLRVDVLHPPTYGFEYPAQCHHYTIRLMSAGCDELRFTSFTLSEVDDDELE
jgi:accessory secretory protein Asp3